MTEIKIILNKKMNKSLKKMADALGVTTIEAIFRSLALLNVAIEENEKGNKISVTKDGEIIKEIIGISENEFKN